MTREAPAARRTGARIVQSMPAVFKVISVIGTVAMLWVGGHLVIANLAETFWHAPYDLLHAVTDAVEAAGPVIVWLADTAVSAVLGFVLGMVVVGIVLGVSRVLKRKPPVGAAH
jgi:hypothetical protein